MTLSWRSVVLFADMIALAIQVGQLSLPAGEYNQRQQEETKMVADDVFGKKTVLSV